MTKRFSTPLLEQSAFRSNITTRQTPEAGREDHLTGYEKLWKAVLAQIIIDARSNSKKAITQRYKHRALDYLFNDEVDFETVCTLAGIDYRIARAELKKKLTPE